MPPKAKNKSTLSLSEFSTQTEISPVEAPGKEPQPVESFPIQSRWLPVKKMAYIYQDVISEQALRALIWEAEAYEKFPKSGLKSNGFLPVIVRPPNQRKVLLDRVEFEKWLTSQQRIVRS